MSLDTPPTGVERIPIDLGDRVTRLDQEDLTRLIRLAGFTLETVVMPELAPGEALADHYHDYKEAVFAIGGEMELHWRNDFGRTTVEAMGPLGPEAYLFAIAPNTPHYLINISGVEPSTLIQMYSASDQPAVPLLGEDSFTYNQTR
jgi:quercetin dioxygenase-like cupin family protein